MYTISNTQVSAFTELLSVANIAWNEYAIIQQPIKIFYLSTLRVMIVHEYAFVTDIYSQTRMIVYCLGYTWMVFVCFRLCICKSLHRAIMCIVIKSTISQTVRTLAPSSSPRKPPTSLSRLSSSNDGLWVTFWYFSSL